MAVGIPRDLGRRQWFCVFQKQDWVGDGGYEEGYIHRNTGVADVVMLMQYLQTAMMNYCTLRSLNRLVSAVRVQHSMRSVLKRSRRTCQWLRVCNNSTGYIYCPNRAFISLGGTSCESGSMLC